EPEELADVGEDPPALPHCGDDGGEVVVGQGHVGRLFAHVGSGDAHGDSDVGGLEGGASLTPSPVIATILPSAWRASTMRSLWTGATRANTSTVVTSWRNASSSRASSWVPVRARASLLAMPRSEAMRTAVLGWSPVIMITRIPAVLASAMAAFTSSRGGS